MAYVGPIPAAPPSTNNGPNMEIFALFVEFDEGQIRLSLHRTKADALEALRKFTQAYLGALRELSRGDSAYLDDLADLGDFEDLAERLMRVECLTPSEIYNLTGIHDARLFRCELGGGFGVQILGSPDEFEHSRMEHGTN
jgi:hypothetical protein